MNIRGDAVSGCKGQGITGRANSLSYRPHKQQPAGWKQILASSREKPRERPRERTRPGPVMEAQGVGLRKLVLVEGVMIVMLAVALYLALALATFSPLDPGWSGTGNGSAMHNSMGSSGAWFADVLYLLFGNLAWLLPLILVWRTVHMFRERRTMAVFSWEVLGLRGGVAAHRFQCRVAG